MTDRRISSTGELITGNLAVKMLGWEDPLRQGVEDIRRKEQRWLMMTSYIKSLHSSFPGVSRGLAVCATFLTVIPIYEICIPCSEMCGSRVQYRCTNDNVSAPDVFLALSLMMIPQLSMATLFVYAADLANEAYITSRRMNAFFRIAETTVTSKTSSREVIGEITIDHGNYGWPGQKEEIETETSKNRGVRVFSKVNSQLSLAATASMHYVQSKSRVTKKRIVTELRQALADVELSVNKGELVGVAGMVGSGKSSLLAALLNDMENLSDKQSRTCFTELWLQ